MTQVLILVATAAAITLAVYVVWRALGRVREEAALEAETRVIEARRQAVKLSEERGAKVAARLILEKYEAKAEVLNAANKAEVERLADDPVALAELLERLSR